MLISSGTFVQEALGGGARLQQVAMIHMWAPMRVWLPLLTFGFVLYFIAEVVAWLANAYSKLEPLAAAEAHARHSGGSLEPRSVFGDVCMTIMGCIYRLYVRSYAAYGADYTPPRASSRE
jgi:hypothetical protein